MLDGVIWKLRDGRIARALLRAEPTTPEPIAPENRLGRRLVWLACAGALGIYVVNGWELEFGVRRPSERGDFARQEKAIQRLRWIGRESHAVQYNLGFGLARDGQLLAARPHLERSLELYPTAKTWTALGNLESVEGRNAVALSALDTAIALDSGYEIAHKRRGEVLAELGELDAAVDALEEAERLAPDNSNIRDSLERVKRWRASADTDGSANTGRPPPP
jgi:tetratricopeptide (TPR) repeat protein